MEFPVRGRPTCSSALVPHPNERALSVSAWSMISGLRISRGLRVKTKCASMVDIAVFIWKRKVRMGQLDEDALSLPTGKGCCFH